VVLTHHRLLQVVLLLIRHALVYSSVHSLLHARAHDLLLHVLLLRVLLLLLVLNLDLLLLEVKLLDDLLLIVTFLPEQTGNLVASLLLFHSHL